MDLGIERDYRECCQGLDHFYKDGEERSRQE